MAGAAATLHSAPFPVLPLLWPMFFRLQNPALDLWTYTLHYGLWHLHLSSLLWGLPYIIKFIPPRMFSTPLSCYWSQRQSWQGAEGLSAPLSSLSKGRDFSDLVACRKAGKRLCPTCSPPPHPTGWKDVAVFLPRAQCSCDLTVLGTGKSKPFPLSHTYSQKREERVGGHSSCYGYETELRCRPLPLGRVQL